MGTNPPPELKEFDIFIEFRGILAKTEEEAIESVRRALDNQSFEWLLTEVEPGDLREPL